MPSEFSFLQDRTVAVMGLGKSGAAAVRALAAAGVTVLAWDDDAQTRRQAAGLGVRLEDLAAIDWSPVSLLLWSPGIAHRWPAPHKVAVAARQAGVPLVCDIELLLRANGGARVVGITGTNGKSTTTTLVGHLLQAGRAPIAIGGNLGVPALDLPDFGADGIYVLELSSYQLELLDRSRFDVAVLLNLSADHLGRHGGMAGYVAAKASLFDRVRPGGVAVIGLDDEDSRGVHAILSQRNDITLVAISAERLVAGGVSAPAGILIDDSAGTNRSVVDLTAIPTLPGRHNWQNACAAYAVARAVGMSVDAIAAALPHYPGLAHRQERVAVIDGVTYVNDSKATNADATARALVCYHSIYWIAGGQPKEGGISSLAPFLSRIRAAFLIGEAAPAFAATLAGRVAVEQCGTLDKALGLARERALAERLHDAVILLSPACASWDQFSSFEQRGNQFRRLVEALPGQRSAA
jgi:UDP-N-acetylmuramoylalanine--D-glutamate ligase